MTKREVWKKRLEQWERSGETQCAFCAKRGLALSSFHWWCAKLRRAERVAAVPFVPLELSATRASAAALIEVELRSKTRLHFEGEAALRALDTLLARIR